MGDRLWSGQMATTSANKWASGSGRPTAASDPTGHELWKSVSIVMEWLCLAGVPLEGQVEVIWAKGPLEALISGPNLE